MKRLATALLIAILALTATHAATNAPLFFSPKAHFAWGAEAGASIDMTGDDMSSVDFDLSFGMRRSWINFLGVGVGADIMVSNSCRSFPLYVDFRTSFQSRPTICFWQLRAGVSLNYLEHNHRQTGIYGFTGVGFNLAQSNKFCSHLVVGYTYRERKVLEGPEMTHFFHPLHYATVKLGLTF